MLLVVLFIVVAFGVLGSGNSGSCTTSSNGMISPVSLLSKGISVLVIGNDGSCGVLSMSFSFSVAVVVVFPTPTLLLLSSFFFPVQFEAWDSRTCQAIEDWHKGHTPKLLPPFRERKLQPLDNDEEEDVEGGGSGLGRFLDATVADPDSWFCCCSSLPLK